MFEFAVFSGHIFGKEFSTPPFLSVFHVMYVMLKGLKGSTLLRVQSLSIKYGIYLPSYLSFLTSIYVIVSTSYINSEEVYCLSCLTP